MAYDLLNDVLVLEVAHYGPDALGGRLADMGARVLKIEDPAGGDPIRRAGAHAVGDENGFSYLHLRWNRGKESVLIDLSVQEGVRDFLKLVEHADVVIEGMRAGVMEKLGLGYDVLRAANPRIVFCSLSGMGASGPYAELASHGPSFDAFAGIGQPVGANPSRNEGPQPTPVGMYAYGLEAAFAVVCAVHRARREGDGVALELAAAECAAHWLPEALDPLLNPQLTFERPGFADATGRMRKWARMENYRCADGKLLFLMCYTDKSWEALVTLLDHAVLSEIYRRTPQTGYEDSEARDILIGVFANRTRADWISRFAEHDIAVMPVNSFSDVIDDPHFKERANVYEVELPDNSKVTLTSTAIRVNDQAFSASLAPEFGENDLAIRKEFGLDLP